MKKLILVMALAIITISNAQDLEYGEVEKVDFELNAPEDDDALIIYRKVDVDFSYSSNNGFSQIREVHERIKINSEEGLKYATQKIVLYDRTSRSKERLKGLKGATYNLVNGKVERTKLKSSGSFEEEINDSWRLETFTMPNVKIGSVIEYTYSIRSSALEIDDIDLQAEVPIANLHIKVALVEYFMYNVLYNPRATYRPQFNVYNENKMLSHGSTGGRWTSKNKIFELDTVDVPALVAEPMSGGLENFKAKMIIELSGTRLPGEVVENFAVTWDAVSRKVLEHPKFGGQIENRKFLRKDVAAVVGGKSNQLERMYTVFDFVKSKVKWDEYYGIFSREGTKQAFKKGSGNVADINLLLVAALKEANIDAHPVLISSKNNGIPLFPTQDGFNYVVAFASIGGQEFLLDATEQYTAPNLLPLRATNWMGRLIRDNGQSSWIELSEKNVSTELTLLSLKLDQDLKATGSAQKKQTHQFAFRVKQNYASKNKVDTYLEAGNEGLEVENVEVKNLRNPYKPLTYSYDIKYEDAAEMIGDKLYITPLLYEANDENPFKRKERNLPVDLNYPVKASTIVKMEIPDGYEIEFLPESKKFVYGADIGSYTVFYSASGNTLNVRAEYEMTSTIILPENYIDWRNFFISIVDTDAEKIVLKKI